MLSFLKAKFYEIDNKKLLLKLRAKNAIKKDRLEKEKDNAVSVMFIDDLKVEK